MSDGVDIPLSSMEELNAALKDIIVEFEDAGGSTGRWSTPSDARSGAASCATPPTSSRGRGTTSARR